MNVEKNIRNSPYIYVFLFVLLCFGGAYIYYHGATESDVVEHIERGRNSVTTARESVERTGRRLNDIEGTVNRIEDRVIDCEDAVERCQKRNNYCRELTVSSEQGIAICKEFLNQLGEEE